MYRGSGRWVFQRDVFIVQKGLFATLIVENRFFTSDFHDLLHEDTGITKGSRGLQGVTRGYRGLQRITQEFFSN